MSEADEKATREALRRYLPADLPQRERLVELAARHLALLFEANRRLNLTAITAPRDAVIKHVLDSVIPAGLFEAARLALDVGSGAGFPGIPLAVVCPTGRFVLAESVGKKARFLERAAAELELSNLEVYAGRAETWLESNRADATVVRAVGSTEKLLTLLGPQASRAGCLLLYKGPSGDEELKKAAASMARCGLRGEVALRYELPEGMGSRSVLRFTPVHAPGAGRRP